MSTRNVDDKNFVEVVLRSNKPTIVDFWADWCMPCRPVSHAMEQLSERYAGKIEVAKCRVDDSPQTSVCYGITSIPAVLFFRDGKVEDKQVGVATFDIYVEKINRIYGNP